MFAAANIVVKNFHAFKISRSSQIMDIYIYKLPIIP